MKTSHPTDEQIRSAPSVFLIDETCDCWSVLIYPSGERTGKYSLDDGLCIVIDSSKVNVIEAWHDRVQSLRA